MAGVQNCGHKRVQYDSIKLELFTGTGQAPSRRYSVFASVSDAVRADQYRRSFLAIHTENLQVNDSCVLSDTSQKSLAETLQFILSDAVDLQHLHIIFRF